MAKPSQYLNQLILLPKEHLVKTIYPLVLITMLTTACSSIVYQEPLTGDRARVRYATDTTDWSHLYNYSDKNCSTGEEEWIGLRVGPFINSEPKSLELPLNNHHINAAKEVYVQSSKPTYSMFMGTKTIGNYIFSCGAPFAYQFETGKDYEALFMMTEDSCSVKIAEIVTTNGTPTLVEKLVSTNKTNDENKGCLQAFKKRGIN